MGKRYGEWLARWRYPVLVLCVLLLAVAGSGGQFLAFKTDYRNFFSEDNPQLQAFEQLQNTYTKTDNVLFVLAPKDGLGWQTLAWAAIHFGALAAFYFLTRPRVKAPVNAGAFVGPSGPSVWVSGQF